jgi:CheY-like chemotaxis protein
MAEAAATRPTGLAGVAASVSAAPLGGASPPATSRAPIVLVIDDDPVAARLVAHHLTRDGYRVEHAVDGEDGLQRARELRPAAITLDVLMPGLDGWSVLQRLKSDPTSRRFPSS